MAGFNAPRNAGANSYFILAKQSTWGTKGDTPIQLKYGFQNFSMRPEITPYVSPDNTGHSGPRKSTPGRINVRGDIELTLGTTHYGELFKWITGDSTVTTTAVADQEMYPSNTSITVGTPLEPGSTIQPSALLASDAPVNAGKIEVILSGASEAGTIVVKGEDANDRPTEETVTFTTPGTHETTKYYKTVNSILLTGVSGTVTATVNVKPETNVHALTFSDHLPPYMTAEVVYDEHASTDDDLITYEGVTPNSVTFNFGEVITMAINCWARRPFFRQNIAGGKEATPTAGFGTRQGNFQADFGTIFKIDGNQYDTSDVNFSLNQNLEENPIRNGSGSVWAAAPVRGDSTRELTCGATINYDQRNDFDAASLGEDVAVEIVYQTIIRGGRHNSVRLNMPQCQWAESATPPIEGAGFIQQTLSLLPYATSAGDELTLEVRNGQSAAEFI